VGVSYRARGRGNGAARAEGVSTRAACGSGVTVPRGRMACVEPLARWERMPYRFVPCALLEATVGGSRGHATAPVDECLGSDIPSPETTLRTQ
jgi:hypothetical protein